MTGRERLVKTFRGQRADRMPISPFIYNNNIFEMFGYKPDINTYLSPRDFDLAEKYVAYHDRFGFDVLFAPGHLWESYIPPSAENWEVTITRDGDQNKQLRTWRIQTPKGELSQTIDFIRSSTYLIVMAQEKYIIESKRDFEIFSKYVPPGTFLDCGLLRRAKAAVGDKGLVNVATMGAFNTLNQFRKLDQMFMDPVEDEGFYRAMMEFLLEWNLKHVLEAIDAGSESIELGGNLATSGSGPRFFEKYVRDYENRLAREIHKANGLVVYHNCGDAQKIMCLYNDMEIDVWGYVTGPPFGDVILDDVLRIIRPSMALRGNIDQVEFLRKAMPADVRERVRALLQKVKPRGNWILSTSDFPFDGQPYENLHAFADAGREFGTYE